MLERNDHRPHARTRFEEIENKDGFYVGHSIADGSSSSAYGVIFTATYPCELMIAVESHTAAGTDGSAVTLNLERLMSGQALDSGDEILSTPFDLKHTANTPQMTETSDLLSPRVLSTGDRIALKDAGALTSIAGVHVTLYLKRLGKGDYR